MGTPNRELHGTLMGTPNREAQECSRNMKEYKDPGRHITMIFLLCSWGSLCGLSIKVPLDEGLHAAVRSSATDKIQM